MESIARELAGWAAELRPSPADLALAERSLADTVAVALAARDHPVLGPASVLGEGGRWAVAGHAVPGAGGVLRVFGTDAQSLQVGFAVDAGEGICE